MRRGSPNTYVCDTQPNTSENIHVVCTDNVHTPLLVLLYCVLDLILVRVLTFSIRIDGNLIQSVIGFFRAYY